MTGTAKPSQLPVGGEIFLDHVGHFVADVEAAADALRQAGFAPAPVSVQVNPDPTGGAPKPTGTGNVCAMFEAGYVEVLFKTADTPLGAELDAARARYSGLHLVAFAIPDADAEHARLAAAGFAMQPVVAMQRPVETETVGTETVGTETGEGIAAFEVVRLMPGQMPEGRIQVLLHKTESSVWQPRWLTHPNGACALAAITIVVADVAEASNRFQRFTGRPAEPIDGGRKIALDRGVLDLIDTRQWNKRWPDVAVPASLPFIGECRIAVSGLADLDARVANGDLKQLRRDPRHLSVAFPPALGIGIWTFVAS